MSPVSDRRRARELALQACYAYELSGNTPESIVTQVIRRDPEAVQVHSFAEELFKRTISSIKLFDDLIKQKAVNWEFTRIAIMDKLILRLAICEFLDFDDIPPKVSIDEAIEIAKKFSTEKSGRFVNGILDAILADFKLTGKLRKQGRGLSEGKRED